jgi:glutamate/tyrosine decarboxylase-like PLP-dependent enzyme
MSALDDLRARCAAPLPHPDAEQMQQLGAEVLAWAVRHYATLPEQPVGRHATRAVMESLLRRPAPETGQDFADLLDEFTRVIAPHAVRTNHPRFLAFIPAAPTFLSVLGDFLASACNFFDGVWAEAAGPAQVELVILDWFKEWLGLPPEAGGLLTGGGSEATLTALVAARARLTFAQRTRAILYVAEQRHWSVDRAAYILGFAPEQVRPVPADVDFRMQPNALAACVAADRARGLFPWAVVANAGTTNTGAVDPLADLAALCRNEHLWLHVDAAYGWAAVLDPAEGRVLAGIGTADSVTLDPHKWFAQPYEVGCVLVRDGRLLHEAFSLRPDYMQDVAPADDEINFCDHGLALTRRFRALKVWMSVQALGLGWFRRLVAHCCALAELSQALLEEAGFEVLSPRRLSIVCFRYRPALDCDEAALDALNLCIIDAVRATERAFLSSTRLRGRVAIRFCFVNWRTTTADVEEVLALLRAAGKELSAGLGHSRPPGRERPG